MTALSLAAPTKPPPANAFRNDRKLVQHDTSVRLFLIPIDRFLQRDDVLEVCVNRPGEVTIETASGAWETHRVDEFTLDHCAGLARALATYTNQAVSEGSPFLSATLPDGERAQFVVPPAVSWDTISITIRKPSRTIWTVDDFVAQGLFTDTEIFGDRPEDVEKNSHVKLRPFEHQLLKLLWDGNVGEFLRRAVRHGRNIVVSGATGSGKTTIMKGIIQECPSDDRIITIEDAREIWLPQHRNSVHLLFGQNSPEGPKVTAATCLKSCKRQRPDRILLAEIRAEECFDYMEVSASGHPGITSLHAGNCADVFGQMQKMIRRNEAGRGLSESEIQQDLKLKVDVIVQCVKERTDDGKLRRQVRELWYRPLQKKQLQMECL